MATTADLYVLQNDYTLTHSGTFSTPGVCGDLASCNYPLSVLPVRWESFNASLKENGNVSLSWEVTQQQKDKGYYVERSKDATNWDELGFVPTFGGYESTEDYSFTDNSPYSGRTYFRIKQVDIDGNSNYSDIKTIVTGTQGSVVSVWPNPAKDLIRVQNNNGSNSVARIYSQSGAMVSENILQAGVNTISVS